MIELLLAAYLFVQAPVCEMPASEVDSVAAANRFVLRTRLQGAEAQRVSDALAQGNPRPQVDEFRVYSLDSVNFLVVVGLRNGCVEATGRVPPEILARILGAV